MPRPRPVPLLAACWFLATATATATAAAQDPAEVLRFEVGSGSYATSGWGGGPPGTLSLDSATRRGGGFAGRIERARDSPQPFSSFTLALPADVMTLTAVAEPIGEPRVEPQTLSEVIADEGTASEARP